MRQLPVMRRKLIAASIALAAIGGIGLAAGPAEPAAAICRPTYAPGWGVYHPEWRSAIVSSVRVANRSGGSWTNYVFREDRYTAANNRGGIKHEWREVYNAPC